MRQRILSPPIKDTRSASFHLSQFVPWREPDKTAQHPSRVAGWGLPQIHRPLGSGATGGLEGSFSAEQNAPQRQAAPNRGPLISLPRLAGRRRASSAKRRFGGPSPGNEARSLTVPPPGSVVHREDRGAAGDDTASHEHPAHRFARFGTVRQSRLAHLLLHFKLPRFLAGLLGDGFVYVGGHRAKINRVSYQETRAVPSPTPGAIGHAGMALT